MPPQRGEGGRSQQDQNKYITSKKTRIKMTTKTKTSSKKEAQEVLTIPALELKTMQIRIVGDSPLIVHKWSEKAKKMILDKQMKKATNGKAIRNPFQEFCDALYWLDGEPENPTQEDIDKARFGFPTVAFKACAIDAGYQQGILGKKTTARGAFHIIGEYAEIEGKPQMREDMVRLGGIASPADLRYRPEFPTWSTVLTIQYNSRAISSTQIANLLNVGGFSNGIGEWRPEKNGQFGMFHVE